MSNESEITDEQASVLADDEGGFFEEGSKRRGTFFQVFDGTICLKSKEVVDGWEGPIKTTHPKTKAEVLTYVKRFDRLVARIINVKKDRKKFDDGTKLTNYNFTIIGGGKRGTLQTTYMDNMLRKFLKVCPNIDFDRPILFGAFKKLIDGKNKQLITIRQGEGSDYDNWPPVPFYWQKETDGNGKPIEGSVSKGRDGSVMPDSVHDEEDDTWDFSAQNKFLVKHFVENELPVIQRIAEARGLNDMTVDDEMPTHTGGAQAEAEIPVVTERPDVIVAPSVSEAMTPAQSAKIRKLAKQVGKTADYLSEKMLEADFDELSVQAASYLIYRIEKKIKKARKEDPNAYPDPDPPSKLKEAALEAKKKKSSDDDDDDEDDWAAAPAPKKAKKSSDDDDDDEDDV